jgi:hypothetical protein
VTYGGPITDDITWDDLFACIGADLIDEANEFTMRRLIDAWLTETFAESAKASVTRAVERDGKKIRTFKGVSVKLDPADFGTLIVQFRALGLISKSARKRSVKDTGTYWTLTPYGDERLTSLRAIVRAVPADVDDHQTVQQD